MRLVVTYMRANPPTIGHEALVNRMKSIPAHDRRIYLSPSSGTERDPLDFAYRYELTTKAFKTPDTFVSDIQCKDFFDMMRFVGEIGYSELTVVVGSDRLSEISKRVKMYNGSLYHFTDLQVVCAGKRDESSDGLEGMSASKMRDAAKLDDYAFFENGLPKKLRSMAPDIFKRVQQACLSRGLATTF